VVIPEIVFVVFQATFAAITCCLIVGAFAERMKFSAVLLFMVLWFTFSYTPIAHMVWYWMGPDAYSGKEVVDEMNSKAGLIWQWGALDFAGGTVVHINAAVAGLVGAYMIGKRIGYGKEAFTPHSLTLTMVGASLLWVGWFGFNAGSALEAGNSAALAFLNTFSATAAAVLGLVGRRGAAEGQGLDAGRRLGRGGRPGRHHPGRRQCRHRWGAMVVGLVAGFACLWGVNGLKKLLGADDSLDVFGVHGVGGIVGALLTGIFNNQALGGPGLVTDWVTATVGSNPIWDQFLVQLKAVVLTVVWSGVVAAISYKVVDLVVGLRVAEGRRARGPRHRLARRDGLPQLSAAGRRGAGIRRPPRKGRHRGCPRAAPARFRARAPWSRLRRHAGCSCFRHGRRHLPRIRSRPAEARPWFPTSSPR
jgi:Amt family ammonium transporter